MDDLFHLKNKQTPVEPSYESKDIVVLEGLEPVRKRPGMYIGGTDENALHHMVNEVFDNSMDEAVAKYATRIELELFADGSVSVKDNGRGIPIDPHPKFPDKSALELIITTLHSGGKFNDKVYNTSGGLHGVGLSVVNALSDILEVEVVRNKKLYKQSYSRGIPTSKLQDMGVVHNLKGCSIKFHPDKEIFGENCFRPKKLYKLAKSKAYLHKNVEVRWKCAPELLVNNSDVPEKETMKFPGGINDFLSTAIGESKTLLNNCFYGDIQLPNSEKKIEWAVNWLENKDGFLQFYCNTIHNPQGGSHENGFRSAIVKSIRNYAETTGNKKSNIITADDIISNCCVIMSVFVHEPQFQGQTKEKLIMPNLVKIIDSAIKDHFDHWLINNKQDADKLLEFALSNAEYRISRRQDKETLRKTITQKIRLPGKLADCSRQISKGTEIFIVEGDSAGGTAKQARNRETQAILPLRGKVLNVASSTNDKIKANQELQDLELALGCGSMNLYDSSKLRYEKVIIMTDADVDGAHISALLMTYFFLRMPELVLKGKLYLAQPPLYKISIKNQVFYAVTEEERNLIIKNNAKNNDKVEISRFKGLGEMNSQQLKDTTMLPEKRKLIQVKVSEDSNASKEKLMSLMGKNPEPRFRFIQEQVSLQMSDELKKNLDI